MQFLIVGLSDIMKAKKIIFFSPYLTEEYQIWWGDMPRILYTFFDTYDLTGKTIVPFCTSGGSGLSETPGTIGGLEEGAEVLEGLHISDSSVDSAEDTVSEWLNRIGQVK